jgi:hypothetical protein
MSGALINSGDPGAVAQAQHQAEAGAGQWQAYYAAKPGEGVPADRPGSSPETLPITAPAAISGCNGWDRQ